MCCIKNRVLLLLLCMTFCAVSGCGQKNEAGGSRASHGVSESAVKESVKLSETDQTFSDPEKEAETENSEKEEAEQMKLETLLYQGHASIRILTSEGKVIYLDPFMGEGYDLAADLILMTHDHYDHTREEMIKNRNEDCRVIKWSDAIIEGKHQTFDLGFVTVEAVEAGYNKNHDASKCVGFILTFPDGTKAYFSGDTSTTPSMAQLSGENLDYAFICCDGVFNMDVEEASECAKLIGAKHTIPYHMEPVKDDSGFDEAAAESFDAPGKIILRPGEELELVH